MKFYNFKLVRCAGRGGYANKASGRPFRPGKLSSRSAPVSALGGEAAGGLASTRRTERRPGFQRFCVRVCPSLISVTDFAVKLKKKKKIARGWHQVHERGSSLRWIEGCQSLTISFFLNCLLGAKVFCLYRARPRCTLWKILPFQKNS